MEQEKQVRYKELDAISAHAAISSIPSCELKKLGKGLQLVHPITEADATDNHLSVCVVGSGTTAK